MKRLLAVLLSTVLISGALTNNVEAGTKTKIVIGVGTAILATGAILNNVQINKKSLDGRYYYLYRHPEQASSYLNDYPEDKQGILDILNEKIQHITRLGNDLELGRANKLLENITGTTYIPPYEQTADNGSTVHINPIQENNPDDSILINPIEDMVQDNIIYTPTGEPINTIMEYPYEDVKTWDEYVLLKSNSQILTDNMGGKRAGYQSHHLLPVKGSLADEAREIFEKYKININNKVNGVSLPDRNNQTATIGIEHNGSHPNTYIKKVNDRIKTADTRGGKEEVLKELANIKKILETAPRDTKWKDVL